MDSGEQLVSEDQSVDEGTRALVIQQSGQYLWEFEIPALWGEAEWILKKEYNHAEAPSSLDLQEAQITQKTNDKGLEAVILYVRCLKELSREVELEMYFGGEWD